MARRACGGLGLATGDFGAHRGGDLGAEELDGAERRLVRQPAARELQHETIVAEDLVLEEDLLNYLFRATDDARPTQRDRTPRAVWAQRRARAAGRSRLVDSRGQAESEADVGITPDLLRALRRGFHPAPSVAAAARPNPHWSVESGDHQRRLVHMTGRIIVLWPARGNGQKKLHLER